MEFTLQKIGSQKSTMVEFESNVYSESKAQPNWLTKS